MHATCGNLPYQYIAHLLTDKPFNTFPFHLGKALALCTHVALVSFPDPELELRMLNITYSSVYAPAPKNKDLLGTKYYVKAKLMLLEREAFTMHTCISNQRKKAPVCTAGPKVNTIAPIMKSDSTA